jgi:hypothetical protein
METRFCRACKLEYPISEFGKNCNRSECDECRRILIEESKRREVAAKSAEESKRREIAARNAEESKRRSVYNTAFKKLLASVGYVR